MTRNQTIIRSSILGISVNILLAAFKLIIGALSRSIAITMDAVNNLSDALSSVITIIGARISGKQPDKKHPFGHGRVEYLTASMIAMIILYAGITALIEAVKKILAPETPNYSIGMLLVIAVTVAVKFFLGKYFSKTGKAIRSDSLIASGQDATLDAVVSLSTLVAAIVFLLWHIRTEAYLAALIALIMIRSGGGIFFNTVSQMLGERPDSEKARAVRETVGAFPEVSGVYDLVLHNYGPDYLIGSMHIEVPEDMTVASLDRLEREITEKVYDDCSVLIAGISVYGKNTENDKAASVLSEVRKCVMAHDHVLQMHGFHLDEEEKAMQFDVVVAFDAPDRTAVYQDVVRDVEERFPEYRIKVGFDADVSD